MKKDALKSGFIAYNDSMTKLQESLDLIKKTKEDSEFLSALEDSAVKRFEVAFEYAWKLMKLAVEYQGSEALGPRPAIQEALRYGFITDPEFWVEALDARNGSVHNYFGISVDEYLRIIKLFIKLSEKFKKQINELIDSEV